MVVELTAARVAAPFVGSSLYTWTSIIGTILAGLTAGSWAGGAIIDRRPTPKTIALFFICSAAFIAVIPPLSRIAPRIVMLELPLPAVILIVSFALFFLPSLFLGAIYPALLRLLSENPAFIGNDSGRLSAVWSIGGIIGVVIAGFFLIGFLGSSATLYWVAGLLFSLALFFFYPVCKEYAFLIVIFLLLVQIGGQPNGRRVLFADDSQYYKIRVVEATDPLSGKLRLLLLDADVHSIERPDGGHLDHYSELSPVFGALNGGEIKNILLVGGGSYAIAKHFSTDYPQAAINVAEVDPAVVKTAERFFGLGDYPAIKTAFQDGRVFLRKNEEKYDLIFGDAFNSFVSIPRHLTTFESNELAKSRLNDGGIYAINFISALEGENSPFFQSMAETFRKSFPDFYVFAFGKKKDDPQNIILVGMKSAERIPVAALKEKIARLKNGDYLSARLVGENFTFAGAPVLTDDFAPTERLMSPLIKNYFRRFFSFYYFLISRIDEKKPAG